MTPLRATRWGERWCRAWRARRELRGDLGQTAIVAVIAITAVASITAGVLVAEVTSAGQAQQVISVNISAANALTAGEHAYLVALNANPSLATCTTDSSTSGTCSGLQYGVWNPVTNSSAAGADPEYYAFGNPQPTFDPTTHALTKLTVQVAGAAYDPAATNHYVFQQETFVVTPANGFLKNVWWSNYESYNNNGNYDGCNYNWSSSTNPKSTAFSSAYYTPGIGYNIDNGGNGGRATCTPVYFGPADYLFGPVFSNDSLFVSGNGGAGTSPAFGSPSAASAVTTADPTCLFVDDSRGMNGSPANCTAANGDVAQYASQANPSDCTVAGTNTSSCANALETPPATNQALKQVAQLDGCLYEGPTQITLVGNQMTVVAPDGAGPLDNNNKNSCPTNGTANLPANGVVYVDNVTPNSTNSNWVAGANPFDGLVYNSATDVSASGSSTVTLTATVTSASSQLNVGATVSFSYVSGGRTHSIGSCAAQPLGTPAAAGSNYTATATCTLASPGSVSYYKAATTAGTYITGSTGQSNTTSTYHASSSYGSNSQVSAGGCSGCYYGQTSNPDTEGDAFVNGHLSGQLTVGTANNVVVDGNITYDDCSTDANGNWSMGQSGFKAAQLGLCQFNIGATAVNDALGLIANHYVEINHPVDHNRTPGVLPGCTTAGAVLCDPATTDAACASNSGLTIDAAVLALNQSFVVNNYTRGGGEGCLTVYGSIQQFARGPVGTFDPYTYQEVSGYQKQYTWDPLLDFVSPPSYLVPSTASWVFQGTNQTAGGYTQNVCPPLTGTVTSINWTTGQATSGSPLADSCDPSLTGGLPNYPSDVAPTPPQNVVAALQSGATAVNVSWSPPAAPNGTITGYTVSSSPDGKTCTTTGATACQVTGLTPGTTYSFTVTATNQAANNQSYTSNPSAPSNAVVIPSLPSPPTNVTAAVNSDGSIQVAWTNAVAHGAPITGYTVTPSPACPGCTYTYTAGATTSSVQVVGLTGGSTYTFTVTATNSLGTSAPSGPSNPVTAPMVPGAPTGVTATPGAGQATVSWTAPGTGGVGITAYIVIPYAGGVAQTPQTFNSTATTETVTGLTNGTSYTFVVEATNPVGTGPASTPSNAVTPANVPGTPTIGTASANLNGSVTVTWTAPSSDGGSPITGYVVTPYLNGTSAQTSQTFTSTATSEAVTGLNPNANYRFKVAAVNAIGTGSPSALSNSVTTASAPGAPGKPSVTAGNGQVTLTWSAPGSSGSSPVNGYVITPSVGGVAQAPISTGSTSTTFTVTGLTNGTTYTFTVAATNLAGAGTASASSNPVTPASTPGAPTGVTATANPDGSVTVAWSPPASNGGSSVTGYVVTPYLGTTAQTSTTFNATATTQTITGLTGGQAYTFTVAAINAMGTGPASAASNPVTPPAAPGAPTGVTATGGNAQAQVSWTAPSSDGGSPITGYVVTPYVGATAQPPTTFTSTATTQTMPGLTNGTTYTFTVAAVNAVGTGAASAASNAVTPVTLPGAPTGLAAVRGNGQVALSWSAPSNGGSPITTYTVTPYVGGTAQTPISTGSSATSYTVTGLTNGTAYSFRVSATNGVGTGPASALVGPVTPASVPGPPTGVSATAGIGKATVTWTAPGSNGASVTGYIVTPYVGTTAQTPVTFTSTATTETINNLSAGTYTFTVAATSNAGTGAQSAPSNAVTVPTVPGAPVIGTATSGGYYSGRATLTFQAPASDGGSPITSYAVTSYITFPWGGTYAMSTQTFTSADWTYNATTKTYTVVINVPYPGYQYSFTVTATNAVGTGAASGQSNTAQT